MSLICNKGCGRRSVKPHLYNHIYLKPNLSFVLFEVYREIVRKACIASFPVDRPALALAAADSIETKNSTTQSFSLQTLKSKSKFWRRCRGRNGAIFSNLTFLFFLFAGSENRKTKQQQGHIATLCLCPRRQSTRAYFRAAGPRPE